jgi:O-antigen ligase
MARRKKNRNPPKPRHVSKAASLDATPFAEASLGDRMRPWLLGAVTSLFVARVLFPSESAANEGDGQVVVMLWALLAVAWAVGTIGQPKFRVRFGWPDAAVGLLIGWHTLAALVALRNGSPRPALNMLWEWVAMGIAFFLVRQLFTGRREARAAVAVMIALAVALSTYGLYQYFHELPATRAMYEENPTGVLLEAGMAFGEDTTARELFENRLASVEPFATFALANSLAAYLAPWLVVALAITIVGFSVREASNDSPKPAWFKKGSGTVAGTTGHRPKVGRVLRTTVPNPFLTRFLDRPPWTTRLGVACLAIPVIGCLLLTKSRAGYLATCTGLGLLAVVWWYGRQASGRIGWKPVMVIVAIVILLAVGVWGAAAVGGIDVEVLSEAYKSLGYRVQYWQSTAGMIADHPWLGCGPGQFQDAYTFYKLPLASEEIADPHNFVLEVWATAGTPAVLALLAVLTTFAWSLCQVGGTPSNGVKKGSGTVAGTTGHRPKVGRVLRTTVPDPFLNLASGQVSAGDREAPEEASNDAPGFVLGGGIVGFVVAVPIALASLAPSGALAVMVGLFPAILTLVILTPWIWRGHMPRSLPAIGVVVLLTGLMFSGGIGAPGVAGTLWLLMGLGLNTSGRNPTWTFSHRAATATLAASVILAGCCYMTSYRPVIGCRGALAAAEADPTKVQFYLEKARSTDRLSVQPPIALATLSYAQWEVNQTAVEFDVLEKYCKEALRLSPQSASTWHQFAHLFHRTAQVTRQPEQIDQALDAYRRAVSLYPTNCRYRADLAEILDQTGNTDGARREAAEALHLDRLTPHADKKLPDEQRKQLSRKILRSE